MFERLREFVPIRALRKVSVISFGTTSNFAFGFLYAVLAARILGPSDYGQLVLIVTAVRLLCTPFNLRFGMPLVDFAHKDSEADVTPSQRILGSILLQGLALVGFGLVFALSLYVIPPYWDLFADWQIALGLYALSEVIFRLRQLTQSVWQTFEYFKSHSAFNFLSATARNVGLIPFMFYGVQEVTLGYLIVEVLLGCILASYVLYLYVRRTFRIPGLSVGSLVSVTRELYLHARSNYLAYLIKQAQNHVEPLILGDLMGTAEVGYYKVGQRFNPVFRLFFNPVKTYLYPRLIEKWKDDRDEFFYTFRKYVYVVTPFFLLVGAVLCLLAPWLIPLLHGAEYGPSVIVVFIMLPPLALEAPFRIFRSLSFVVRKARVILNLYVLRFVVGLPLFLVLTYSYGYVGAAVAGGLISLLVVFYKAQFMVRELGWRWLFPTRS